MVTPQATGVLSTGPELTSSPSVFIYNVLFAVTMTHWRIPHFWAIHRGMHPWFKKDDKRGYVRMDGTPAATAPPAFKIIEGPDGVATGTTTPVTGVARHPTTALCKSVASTLPSGIHADVIVWRVFHAIFHDTFHDIFHLPCHLAHNVILLSLPDVGRFLYKYVLVLKS